MKSRNLLALFLIPMGLIIAAVPQNKTRKFMLNAPELLTEVNTRSQYVDAETVADMIVKKDPALQLIDVRSQEEFEKYS
jgi:3-mercaptopyruvate sulfurtransferase SseA